MQHVNPIAVVVSMIKNLGSTTGKTNRRRRSRKSTAESGAFLIEGELKPGRDTDYAVEGHDFVVDEGTWLFGELKYGSLVTVWGCRRSSGDKYAKKIAIHNAH